MSAYNKKSSFQKKHHNRPHRKQKHYSKQHSHRFKSQPKSFGYSFEQVKKFPGVFKERKGKNTSYFVATTQKKAFFDEFILSKNGSLYRQVDPERSKLFAAIANDISQIGFKEDSRVLYLGASHGYTPNFLADMLVTGRMYALDFAPRVLRDLVFVCEAKANMAPLLADANNPSSYKADVCSTQEPCIDVVFMDIAQRNQVDIFVKNCDEFLVSGGFGLLALKARSVDVTKEPKVIFRQVRKLLDELQGYSVVDYKELAPFETDHAMFVVKKK